MIECQLPPPHTAFTSHTFTNALKRSQYASSEPQLAGNCASAVSAAMTSGGTYSWDGKASGQGSQHGVTRKPAHNNTTWGGAFNSFKIHTRNMTYTKLTCRIARLWSGHSSGCSLCLCLRRFFGRPLSRRRTRRRRMEQPLVTKAVMLTPGSPPPSLCHAGHIT